MRPFEPIGDQARWRTIYEMFCDAAVGDVVSYSAIAAALDVKLPQEMAKLYPAITRAAREHEVQDDRVIEMVRGRGCRIVEPAEQLRLARVHEKKARKSLARGHSKVVHVDFNGMDPDTRKAFEIVAGAFARQMDINARTARRQAELDEALRKITTQQQHTSGEVSELKARLARLERRPRPAGPPGPPG